MRAVANSDTRDLTPYINSAYCSGCGICENYACPQSLSPRSIILEFKAGLRGGGIKIEKLEPAPIEESREYRKLPVHRLAARLGLLPYDVAAPFEEKEHKVKKVRIPLSQHIGVPAVPVVKAGEAVEKGEKIGEAGDGLSVSIHSSVRGIVEKVSDREIVIKAL
jgi:Na+-translocating ferredoxin:NAD+ oxidoreductase RnfC subunit